MRLTNIKISGFKSFVDKTEISLSTKRTGIIGPNGCGKSNIIDAVKWVLGETSKHIKISKPQLRNGLYQMCGILVSGNCI